MEEIKVGNFILKLADNEKEFQQLYKLRYKALLKDYNENLNIDNEEDIDIYDSVCDHLIIVDTSIDEVIGTYRLIKKSQLTNIDKFLTESEFDLTPIKNYEVLEIGRAVVKEEYRNGAAISLLWKGLLKYAIESGADYMIGTASFHGVDPSLYYDTFAYLHDNYLSAEEIRCEVNKESCYLVKDFKDYDLNTALANLPPLIKGYLRLGATIGNGVYKDISFNSLDVLIVLKMNEINQRYLKKFLQ